MIFLFFSTVFMSASLASSIFFYVLPQDASITNAAKLISQNPQSKEIIFQRVSQEKSLGKKLASATSSALPKTDTTPSLDESVKMESILPTPSPSLKKVSPTTSPTKPPTPTQKPISPTRTISTPTPTQISLQRVLPTPTPPLPTSTPKTAQSGLHADTIFTMVNDYRKKYGLETLQKDEKTCTIAQQRAPQVSSEIAGNTMHAGLTAMQLPYWISENIISYHSEQAAVDWWINDTIHRNAMLGKHTYSCVACSGYSCSQVFTSYIPK